MILSLLQAARIPIFKTEIWNNWNTEISTYQNVSVVSDFSLFLGSTYATQQKTSLVIHPSGSSYKSNLSIINGLNQ